MENLFIPPDGITEENVAQIKERLDRATALLERHDRHVMAVGGLATVWAGLDTAIDGMFEPLLDCSEAQVACILVENIATRCDMIKRLLYVEPLAPTFIDWAAGLLNRASSELAPLRNRFIHDASVVTPAAIHRADKRAKIGKPQSRQKTTLIYKTVHEVKVEEIDRLSDCISTVTLGLSVAKIILERWRSGGPRPRVNRRWLPACKPNARYILQEYDPRALPAPPRGLRFEFG